MIMDAKSFRKYEGRSRVIKALAHPSRLYIVDKLAEREYCVNELTSLIGSEMSTVSKHLSVLKNAGVVKDEKRGASIFYSLRIPCILNFFKCADAVLDAIKEDQSAFA
ncbi:MAG TPA: metalloregulator ArsR/SmtB family transcription factor [Spirochaetia bacterium]|nr:metalloregulator ArsR/SmtB family transcription factor [Spirochaetia bacterium]